MKNKKILVVDDEPNILGLLEQSLNDHEVTKALNAAEAIRQLDSHPFDAVLCDIVMPEQSGFVVYVAAQKIQPSPPAFAFMTGGTLSESESQLIEQLAVPCLLKPFSLTELERLLTSLMSNHEQPKA